MAQRMVDDDVDDGEKDSEENFKRKIDDNC